MISALAQALSNKKGNPKDDLVTDQFRKLIKLPLEADLKEKGLRSQKTVYPVIIIDALDECNSADDTNWRSLLASLKCWATLPGVFKLVVTSRDLHDIRATLGELSCHVDLTSRDGVSEESKKDIEIFFAKKFGEIRGRFKSLSKWPTKEEIEAMTEYAAGLFIWANMVIEYVGQRAGNPVKRLENVLGDIKPQSGNKGRIPEELNGRDRVDRLYARIVLEAFRHSAAGEREVARRILAAVVLAKEPLRTCDLVDLLSTNTSDRNDLVMSIESTFLELSPIIPISDDGNDTLRVFHKTVSDFLLSHDRSYAALKSIVKSLDDPASIPDIHSFILDPERDNESLALACIRLIHRSFSLDIHSIAELLKQSDGPFYYARQYWLGHLEGAGVSWEPTLPNFRSLANAMEVAYRCLERYANEPMLAKEEAVALRTCLRDTSSFVIRCINQDNLSRSSQKMID